MEERIILNAHKQIAEYYFLGMKLNSLY